MSPKNRLWALAACLFVCTTSCNTVEFYEKGALQGPLMEIGTQRTQGKLEQKIFYATEGSAGGLGNSAGGGCGCY
ncbi:MAG: hypothetical protein ACI8QC_003509 [Planctomycetota bacterium]|jgi:hypothetical protein